MEGFINAAAAFFSFDRVFFVFWLTLFINLINTLTRSSRLAGVRTGRLATAISLFGIIFLAASFANTLQSPLLTSTVERKIITALSFTEAGSASYQVVLGEIEWQLRLILGGASAGVLLGLVLIPSFVASFVNVVNAFGRAGSVFRLFPLLFFSLGQQERVKLVFRLPSWETLREIFARPMDLPRSFLYWSALSYSVWTVNVLAGLYVTALFPEYRIVAINTAAIFGNLAIVLNVLMVDPVMARVTDGVAVGKRDELVLKQMIFYLALANLGGTLLSQILLLPIAQLVLKLSVIISSI